ncbi:LLM class flavin-dependent oxidoreductase [Micromonospora sp. NPDC093277]|uniref:LLM class flavin-dependent oxidoreductase n=1 Tax=Micromonospora sp. NPDC093277 TaxID=3364291 RepID=UPI0037F4F81F
MNATDGPGPAEREYMGALRFGCFISPLHRPGEDPVLLLQRDLRLAELADDLNFDEFWVGEHHSAGWGTITSPELFIAAAAERTRRITLATGVMTLPYHHPFMAAERAMQLDNLTRGRFILGVGAGSVPSDMHMLGIDPSDTRRRTEESLETILPLLRGEVVTREADWFRLRDARIQLRPFRPEGFPVAVASAMSPFGMRLAGRMGADVLSYVAPPWGMVRPGQGLPINQLAEQWGYYEAAARDAGHEPSRQSWRLLVPVHVADSRQEALDEIFDGWLRQRAELWAGTMGMPMATSDASARKAFEATVEAGGIIAGDIDDCISRIGQLGALSGGFGCLLISVMDWATPERTNRSLERFARFVAPNFRHSMEGVFASNAWATARREHFQNAQQTARVEAMQLVTETGD